MTYLVLAFPGSVLIIAPYTSRLRISFFFPMVLVAYLNDGRRKPGCSFAWLSTEMLLLTSLASLCSISKLFAFDAFRASSSSSLASVSFSYLSTQYSSFSSTFCMGIEWCSARYKECTGERFATIMRPVVRMVVRVL